MILLEEFIDPKYKIPLLSRKYECPEILSESTADGREIFKILCSMHYVLFHIGSMDLLLSLNIVPGT